MITKTIVMPLVAAALAAVSTTSRQKHMPNNSNVFRRNGLFSFLLIAALGLACGPSAWAEDSVFTYQGRLTVSGAPFTGSAEFIPTLWTSEVGGSQVAASNPAIPVAEVSNGLFTLHLDFGSTSFPAGSERWLQLEVRTVIGPFTLLGSRQRITAVPYAIMASDTARLDGLHSSAFVRTAGPAAISATDNSSATLTVTQGGSQHGLRATTASTSPGHAAVTGQAGPAGPSINSVAGVFGTSNVGRGIIGSSGANDGVYGFSTSGQGVAGQSIAGTGVRGETFGTTGETYGVYGRSQSTNSGAGVRGLGPYVGIWGSAISTSGFNWGVYGTTSSTGGYGGYFSAPSGGVAGRFVGNVQVTGSLSKGSGSFKIDHPLDPANKYLYHSFVESPDMMNVYNGNAVLDETGSAVVALPDYFGALNRDFRYQLTPVGGPGPNLHIAEPMRENAFRIAGGSPGLLVSWQVTGIRQDDFANANRIVVEVEKPESERGSYLYPEAAGLTAAEGIDAILQTGPEGTFVR